MASVLEVIRAILPEDAGKEQTAMRLRDMWLWNSALLRPVVIGSSLATVVLVGVLCPFFGTEALYFLFVGMTGPLIGLIYGVVGKKVAALKQSLAEEKGMIEESLIVIDTIQSPGVAILTDSALKLFPIMGTSRSIDLSTMDSIRMTHMFNGKSLIWKKWLVVSVKPRLGFALPESTAQEWYEHFANGQQVGPCTTETTREDND